MPKAVLIVQRLTTLRVCCLCMIGGKQTCADKVGTVRYTERLTSTWSLFLLRCSLCFLEINLLQTHRCERRQLLPPVSFISSHHVSAIGVPRHHLFEAPLRRADGSPGVFHDFFKPPFHWDVGIFTRAATWDSDRSCELQHKPPPCPQVLKKSRRNRTLSSLAAPSFSEQKSK